MASEIAHALSLLQYFNEFPTEMASSSFPDLSGMSFGDTDRGSADSRTWFVTCPDQSGEEDLTFQIEVPALHDVTPEPQTTGLDLLAMAAQIAGIPAGQGEESPSDVEWSSLEKRRLAVDCGSQVDRGTDPTYDDGHLDGPDRKRLKLSLYGDERGDDEQEEDQRDDDSDDEEEMEREEEGKDMEGDDDEDDDEDDDSASDSDSDSDDSDSDSDSDDDDAKKEGKNAADDKDSSSDDSDDDTDDIACPTWCICKTRRRSRSIKKKKRKFQTITPLLEKLLRQQTLSRSKQYQSPCCWYQCCRRWKRIPARWFVSHYHPSDLSVMRFSWGDWKPDMDDTDDDEDTPN